MELLELKKYIRVDGDFEDDQISALLLAAKEYMTNAGVIERQNSELYNLALKLLVSNWYDNRTPVGSVTNVMEYSLKAIISQLYWSDDIQSM